MKKITHTPFVIISLLFLFVQPLQAAQIVFPMSGADTIDTAPISDYQPISEKGVDKFEEYLLMLQKKCVETATVENGITLVVGTTGSGKSTMICDLLGVPLVGVRNNEEEDDDSSDEDEENVSYAAIDIDPTYKLAFPAPKIGQNLSQSQTFLPTLFSNPKAKDGLHYCDMPGFDDTRGEKEKVIASIAPALILHSAKKIKAILAIISYDNIISSKGKEFMKAITDIMVYFKHAPWDAIKEATFIAITKCARVQNSDVKKAIKDLIRGVDNKLAEKRQEYNQALNGLHAHNSNKITLDKNKKNEYEKAVSSYEVLKTQERFFTIFSEIDPQTKKIKCDKKKLLFSRPLHKQKAKYRAKIIEALKSSPGLKKSYLSACDYSNPTLSRQLDDVVGRMSKFLSTRENLKTQNQTLQKSISDEKGIQQQIKEGQNKIITTSAEIEIEKTNVSFVPIYNPPAYQRTFSSQERSENLASRKNKNLASRKNKSLASRKNKSLASRSRDHVAFGSFAPSFHVGGPVCSTATCNVAINAMIGSFFSEFSTEPKKRLGYVAYEPVYRMRVTYGPGTFKNTSPNTWNINRESANGLDTFNYEPNNIRRDYPVPYAFEYRGYFNTNGSCQLTLYSKYNELRTTKNRITILEESVNEMQQTIKALTKDKESKERTIISNKEEIDKLDQCIINTYEKRDDNQGIAYCLSKCEMLAFFVNKPLFNANAAAQMNDDNDEKDDEKEEKKEEEETEMDHPLKVNMQRCIEQWRQWLKENSDKK